ncbi:hypothetical protein K491DRAFT_699010 [Lophiostoma macrostomum CBS 122681]|uniref:Uncharacterized protein n=1 Tax=Lophiostoma macrostomum CBS 122681 TaxID=1314788 RepID=A0A6A6SKF6_9PLEO|nr:hypothetical protein K491DRAFT_699010 [Lophiostoma macrostomum CBS 122681]
MSNTIKEGENTASDRSLPEIRPTNSKDSDAASSVESLKNFIRCQARWFRAFDELEEKADRLLSVSTNHISLPFEVLRQWGNDAQKASRELEDAYRALEKDTTTLAGKHPELAKHAQECFARSSARAGKMGTRVSNHIVDLVLAVQK